MYNFQVNHSGCGNDCIECSTKKIITQNVIEGFINIYDIGGLYQTMSALYDTEIRAKEIGEMVKGYIGTVFISLNKKGVPNGKIG